MASNQMRTSAKLLLVILFLALSLGVGKDKNAAAQVEEEGWREAANLSQSGSSFSPVMVMDHAGKIHVVWQDAFDGVLYSARIEGEWTTPQPISVPWAAPAETNAQQQSTTSLYVPTLMADSTDRIHAFWIGDENKLYYSYATSAKFGDKSWSSKQLLAESVIGYEATVDSQDGLHISYVRSTDTDKDPSGVYYRSRKPKSTLWKVPTLLYESRYFREIVDGNIDVGILAMEETVDEAIVQTVFVSWDHRPRKEFFLIRSGDDGVTWDEPLEVARPENNTDTGTPNGVGMVAFENEVLLVWKEIDVEIPSNCTQFSQVFSRTGKPQGTPTPMLRELPGCPLENQTLINENGAIILQTSILNQIYLLSWDGRKWSLPQAQPELSSIIDTETFQPIQLRCVQVIYGEEDELFLIGCDSGSGGDIWFTSRTQGDISSWFAKAPAWSSPISIISSAGEISHVSLVSDQKNLLHAVWAQSTVAGGEKSIYYARWDGQEWTHILPILEPPLGQINQLTTTIDVEGRLFLVWSGGKAGEVYFSWANASRAGNASEWATPVALPMPRLLGSSPDIAVAENGTIFVTYAIPLNEKRGIYLTRSVDSGITWSDPMQILDGAVSGWEIIDHPTLGITADGTLQVVFVRFPAPNEVSPKYLYYSQSTDQGDTWASPEEIIGAEVLWSSTGNLLEGTVYRLWQETSRGGIATLIETSTDNGLTWTMPSNFAAFESRHAVSEIALDGAGNLHLVQLSERATEDLALPESLALQEWIWNGSGWTQGERYKLGSGTLSENNFIAVSITVEGNLGVLFTKLASEGTTERLELVFMERKLEITGPVRETPSPTASLEPGLEVTATPTISVTATTSSPLVAEETREIPQRVSSTSSSDSIVFGVIAGFLSAGIIVLGTFFIFSRFTKRD